MCVVVVGEMEMDEEEEAWLSDQERSFFFPMLDLDMASALGGAAGAVLGGLGGG